MSASHRTKGKRGELEVIHTLRQFGWSFAARTSDGRSQNGRNDISGGPQGCAIEIKRQERLNVPAAFDQLMRDSDPIDVPILVHRPSRHVWMATLPFSNLLELLRLKEDHHA